MKSAARRTRRMDRIALVLSGFLIFCPAEALCFAGFLPSASLGYSADLAEAARETGLMAVTAPAKWSRSRETSKGRSGGAASASILEDATVPTGKRAGGRTPGGMTVRTDADASAAAAIPEPTTLILIGGGLLGFAGWRLIRRT
jgi:hypothetical protein